MANPYTNTSSRDAYRLALDDLANTFRDLLTDGNDKLPLVASGVGVYREVRRLASSRHAYLPTIELTKILIATKRLIDGKLIDADFQDELYAYSKLCHQISCFPWAALLRSTMLALIGTVIVVTSGVIALASFGILLPINLLGVTFGSSMLTGGIAMSAGALFGSGSLIKSGVSFYNAAKMAPLRQEMQLAASTANARYGI